jgi:hypothetical protein
LHDFAWRNDEAQQGVRHRALAATGLADHTDDLSFTDVQADPVDRLDHTFVGEEVRLEVLELE